MRQWKTHVADPIPEKPASPDDHLEDLLGFVPSPTRYDVQNREPEEAPMLLASLVPQGARVLDVGCGTGCNSNLIRETRGAEVVGIEPQVERARLAQRSGMVVHVGFLTADLLPKLGQFDVVMFADVLEHVANPGHLVRIAAQALRPEGSLVISVPNAAHWSVRTQMLRGNFEYEQYGIMDATHLRWFTQTSLEQFLRQLGFDVVERRYTSGASLPAYDRRWPWRWLNRQSRRGVIRSFVRRWPRMFACQFVFRARRFAPAVRSEGRTSDTYSGTGIHIDPASGLRPPRAAQAPETCSEFTSAIMDADRP